MREGRKEGSRVVGDTRVRSEVSKLKDTQKLDDEENRLIEDLTLEIVDD